MTIAKLEVKVEVLGARNGLVSIDGIVTVVKDVNIPNRASNKKRRYLMIAEAFKIQAQEKTR